MHIPEGYAMQCGRGAEKLLYLIQDGFRSPSYSVIERDLPGIGGSIVRSKAEKKRRRRGNILWGVA